MDHVRIPHCQSELAPSSAFGTFSPALMFAVALSERIDAAGEGSRFERFRETRQSRAFSPASIQTARVSAKSRAGEKVPKADEGALSQSNKKEAWRLTRHASGILPMPMI